MYSVAGTQGISPPACFSGAARRGGVGHADTHEGRAILSRAAGVACARAAGDPRASAPRASAARAAIVPGALGTTHRCFWRGGGRDRGFLA